MSEQDAEVTFRIPRRFRPSYSLLGRWLRRRLGDDWQAGGVHVLVLTSAATLVALLGQALESSVGNGLTAGAWTLGAMLLVAALGLAGWKPATTVQVSGAALRVEQGETRLHIATEDLLHVETVTPLAFHRHYRRYRNTRAFFATLENDLLVLHTTTGPVVLGLRPDEQAALCAALEGQPTKTLTPANA